MDTATNQLTAALLVRAEAAGFELRQVQGLAIATLPAAADPAETESVLQELVARAPEIVGELRARDEAARSRRFAGRPAICPSLMEFGTVERRESDGRLVVACLDPKGEHTNPLSFPPDELMLIAAADKRMPRVDVSRAGGDAERTCIERAEKHGVRFWAEDRMVVFGWPDLAQPSIVPLALRSAIREATSWASSRGRPSSPYSSVNVDDAICYAFLQHVRNEAALECEFGSRKRADRETAALCLLLSGLLQGLRAMLGCQVTAADSEELDGKRAFVRDSGLAVEIHNRGRDGRIIVRDVTGRQLAYSADRLLAVETERPSKQEASAAAAVQKPKPRFLPALRGW